MEDPPSSLLPLPLLLMVVVVENGPIKPPGPKSAQNWSPDPSRGPSDAVFHPGFVFEGPGAQKRPPEAAVARHAAVRHDDDAVGGAQEDDGHIFHYHYHK